MKNSRFFSNQTFGLTSGTAKSVPFVVLCKEFLTPEGETVIKAWQIN